MYKVLVLIILMCVSCYKQEKINIVANKPTEKKIEKVYSVDADTRPAGYLYEYQWENSIGVERNNYFAYDLVGNPVGYISNDGQTIKFDHEKKTPVGNFNLDIALKKIYNSNNVKYTAILEKEVNNQEAQSSVKKGASKKREQTDVTEDEIYEDEYSDDEYSDDEYSDDEYSDSEYSDDEYDEDFDF